MRHAPISNEDGLGRNYDEFQFHQIDNHPLPIGWHTNKPKGSVDNPQTQSIKPSSYDEEIR